MANKPLLHVEIQLRSSLMPSGCPLIPIATIQAFKEYFVEAHHSVRLGNEVSGEADVHLDVHPHMMLSSRAVDITISSDDAANAPDIVPTYNLPNEILAQSWQSLHFHESVDQRLLHYATRMMRIVQHPALNKSLIHFNRILLLHGPAGSGKTSLSRGLAHKLAIRLSDHFSRGRLVEINANSLHSKWFGESGKMIAKLFDQIHDLAKDSTQLVCVLIDEVETVAGCRQRVIDGNDIGDALRATNQLLTALDGLRAKNNVIVFCTSNLKKAVDSAFLDRVDIDQYVGDPGADAVYDILSSSLNELIRRGIVQGASAGANDPTMAEYAILEPDGTEASYGLPNLDEVKLQTVDENGRCTPGMKLYELASTCKGKSGRHLRRLTASAVAMYTFTTPCSLAQALSALKEAIGKEDAILPVRGGT